MEDEIHGLKNKLAMKAVKKLSASTKDKYDVQWNFTKYLIDKEGNLVRRLSPIEDPMKLEDTIKELLK
jgi:glutathione peroxidase